MSKQGLLTPHSQKKATRTTQHCQLVPKPTPWGSVLAERVSDIEPRRSRDKQASSRGRGMIWHSAPLPGRWGRLADLADRRVTIRPAKGSARELAPSQGAGSLNWLSAHRCSPGGAGLPGEVTFSALRGKTWPHVTSRDTEMGVKCRGFLEILALPLTAYLRDVPLLTLLGKVRSKREQIDAQGGE